MASFHGVLIRSGSRSNEARYPELYRILSSYGWVQIHELGAALSIIRDAFYLPVLHDCLILNVLVTMAFTRMVMVMMEDCVGRNNYNLKGLKPRS